MIKMSDSTESSAYFYRIITLVVDIGTETVREAFYSQVPKESVETAFSAVTSEFQRLKSKHVLTDTQYQLLTVSPDPEKYDITLLITLLTTKKISGIKQPKTGWGASPDPADLSLAANLIRLREKRNEFVGHRPSAQLDLFEYKRTWGEIENILIRIARSISPDLENKIKEKIKNAATRMLEPLDDREYKLLQVFLQWRKEDEDKQHAKLTDVQTSLANLHLKVDGLPKPQRAIDETDAVRSDDTLSSLQSQVISIAESIGGMAQQDAVQQIHQNVQTMQDQINTLGQTVQTLLAELDEKRKENEHFFKEITQLRQRTAESGRVPGGNTEPKVIYQRQSQSKKPKINNPNALSEKEILDLSRKIGYEWEQLRIHLEFTEAQAHALKKAYDDDVQQRIHVMLKSWHDVVAECGENPKMLLAAAFVNASQNYSMAYKLVPKNTFDAFASAKQSTVERIEQITFRKSGYSGDQGDGVYQTGRNSPYGYGGPGSMNVYGGDLRIEGSLTIQSSSAGSSSNSNLVASDAPGGAQPSSLPSAGSLNVFDGKLVMAAGSKVVIGPPGSSYTSASQGQLVRGEGLDVPDMGPVPDKGPTSSDSSGGFGQPFKKERDETLSQSMVAALNEQMKSVGVIITHGQTVGTVFRVGTKFVMTALHVIRDVIDPAGRGETDTGCLEKDETYITFNESAIGEPRVFFRIKKDIIYNIDLDLAVLEISNPSSLPMKMNLAKPKLFGTGVTSVSLIGYGHKDHSKKCLDPKCEIISPTAQKIKSALAWLAQNWIYYKSVLNEANQSELVDQGYHGYENPTKMLIHCFLEHGASGAPAITNDNERSIEVVGMLTGGLPEFYFKLPQTDRGKFPVNYRFELATRMTSIYDWIKATQSEELVKDLFN